MRAVSESPQSKVSNRAEVENEKCIEIMLAKELNERVWRDGSEISMTKLELMPNYLRCNLLCRPF